ncbi:hypothetical protein X798_03182 [Onchocerca flexuosa]|uniref:PurM-like N-terminal domain-containing protein n=1 Tax=Onchocerca flexuosa TaxID=387005 RepID=A0A238BWX6_9BILA|nr:hypothetical protein X798_03182 [Onchocerca flexuosa]
MASQLMAPKTVGTGVAISNSKETPENRVVYDQLIRENLTGYKMTWKCHYDINGYLSSTLSIIVFTITVLRHSVSSTERVGTKLLIVQEVNEHDTIGIDLIAMCLNDLLAQGAMLLFFLGYFATVLSLNRELDELMTSVFASVRKFLMTNQNNEQILNTIAST